MSPEKTSRLEQFRAKRAAQNEKVMSLDHLGVKRFFNLDTTTYKDGALSSQTKELLGLVAVTPSPTNVLKTISIHNGPISI